MNMRVFGFITFYWKDKTGVSKLDLHDKTIEEALNVARYMGYRDRCWYRPSTWGNHFVFYN